MVEEYIRHRVGYISGRRAYASQNINVVVEFFVRTVEGRLKGKRRNEVDWDRGNRVKGHEGKRGRVNRGYTLISCLELLRSICKVFR